MRSSRTRAETRELIELIRGSDADRDDQRRPINGGLARYLPA